jgi:glucose/arabinose dehydrogenase
MTSGALSTLRLLRFAVVLGISTSLAQAAPSGEPPPKIGGFMVVVPSDSLGSTAKSAVERAKAVGAPALELRFGQPLGYDEALLDADLSDERRDQLRTSLKASGVQAVTARVALTDNPAQNEKVFTLAKQLGLRALAVDWPTEAVLWEPKVEGKTSALDRLGRLAEKYDIACGLVTPARDETKPDFRAWEPNHLFLLVTNRQPRLGICADLANLSCSGLKPLEALKVFEPKLYGCRMEKLSASDSESKALLVELKRQSFDLPLTVGSGSSDPTVAQSLDFVRREGEAAALAGLREAEAQVRVPNGFRYEILAQHDVPEPIDLQFAPDGRLWFTGRDGHIWTLDVTTRATRLVAKLAVDHSDDRGLLGLDFHPDFDRTGFAFFFYAPPQVETNKPHSRVSRFTFKNQRADAELVEGSEKILLELPIEKGGQHTGGGLTYNPKDGKLYVTTGDNNRIVDLQKYYDDPENRAQNLNDLRGKTLRLNLDGSIPADNPCANQPGKRGEIWTRGHRQPWRIRVDSVTGILLLSENGGDRDEDFEEINRLEPGGNYGWPRVYENSRDMFTHTNTLSGFVNPWWSYSRKGGGSSTCSLFYRDSKGPFNFPPEYRDVVFYSDYNRKSVRVIRVDPATNKAIKSEPFALNFGGGPVAMQRGPDGALYLIEYGGWFRGSQRDRVSRVAFVGEGALTK